MIRDKLACSLFENEMNMVNVCSQYREVSFANMD